MPQKDFVQVSKDTYDDVMNRKKEETDQPLKTDVPLTSEMQSDDKPAGGEAVPTDSRSPAVPQRDSTTQWGKNFLRAEQIKSDITFCKACLKTNGRRVQLDEGATACSFCRASNPTTSQFTESLRKASRADEDHPKLTMGNLLEIDRDTNLPLGKIGEDDRTEYSCKSEGSSASTVFDSINVKPANQVASSEEKA